MYRFARQNGKKNLSAIYALSDLYDVPLDELEATAAKMSVLANQRLTMTLWRLMTVCARWGGIILMRLKSIGVLRGYAMGETQLSRIADNIEREVEEALESEHSENAKLRESLERAAGIIADICGECPVSRYEWLSSDGCAEKCGTITEDECWIAYLTGKRWDESGAEVDE